MTSLVVVMVGVWDDTGGCDGGRVGRHWWV